MIVGEKLWLVEFLEHIEDFGIQMVKHISEKKYIKKLGTFFHIFIDKLRKKQSQQVRLMLYQ